MTDGVVETTVSDPDATLVHVRLPEPALQVAAETHVGRVRSHNEDAFLVDLDSGLVAVADGMGGHASGEVASREVLAFLATHLRGRAASAAVLTEALKQANRRIFAMNRQRHYGEGMGMGTTVAGLWFGKDGAFCFHVGDSRVYRYRDGTLVQLTRDHSLYQAWVDAGSQGIAPAANILTRSIGSFAEVEPEVVPIAYAPGDLYLLCSDGLTRYWTRARLQRFFADADDDLPHQVQALVRAANANDGSDNITAILVRVEAAV